MGAHCRHPKKKFGTTFINTLKENIAKLESNKSILVTGDFNYDILKYQINPIITEFLDFMYSNFLQPTISEPTRITINNRPSLTGNIFTNLYDKNIDSGNLQDKT